MYNTRLVKRELERIYIEDCLKPQELADLCNLHLLTLKRIDRLETELTRIDTVRAILSATNREIVARDGDIFFDKIAPENDVKTIIINEITLKLGELSSDESLDTLAYVEELISEKQGRTRKNRQANNKVMQPAE